MTSIYQHWTGSLKATANPLGSDSHTIDIWIPEQKPVAAVSIAKDSFSDSIEVFHKVIALTGKIGPFHITLGEDILFHGQIEYFKVP